MINNTIKVSVDNTDIEIKKIPIIRYAELIKAVKPIFKQLQDFDGLETSTVLDTFDTIVEENLPALIKGLAIATPLKTEQIEQLGISEIFDLTKAVIEVNNYQKIFSGLRKNVMAPKASSTK